MLLLQIGAFASTGSKDETELANTRAANAEATVFLNRIKYSLLHVFRVIQVIPDYVLPAYKVGNATKTFRTLSL
jgi:hypothetical protein